MTSIWEISHLWIILINHTVTYKVWFKKAIFAYYNFKGLWGIKHQIIYP